MSNSFEFLPADHKRIRFPAKSLMLFIGISVFFVFSIFLTNFWRASLRLENEKAKKHVRAMAQKYFSDARKMLVKKNEILNLGKTIQKHNQKIGSPRSAWTQFFNLLEEVLPKDATILSLKNSNDSSSVFLSTDRNFNLIISVSDIQQANSLYNSISTNRAFESLSFNPVAEAESAESARVKINLSFRFNENNV
jgi:hypothetical protein